MYLLQVIKEKNNFRIVVGNGKYRDVYLRTVITVDEENVFSNYIHINSIRTNTPLTHTHTQT